MATVNTGKKPTEKPTEFRENKKAERDSNERNIRSDTVRKHLNSDFHTLCDIISYKRDITKQITYKDVERLLKKVGDKKGYVKVIKHLQHFCDLDSAPVHLIWKPLKKQKKLIVVESGLHTVGTTFILPLGPTVYYSVYLNPKFILDKKSSIRTIAHELSHIYASHNNIVFTPPDTVRGKMEYEEQMTDLLGIVLGMGELFLDDSYDEKKESLSTCYLTNQLIDISYKKWKSDFLSGRIKDIKTLVICGHCSQKIRAPINKKKFILICPKCKNNFIF